MAITTDSLLMDISVNSQNAAKSLDTITKKLLDMEKQINSSGDAVKGAEGAFKGLSGTIVVMNQAVELAGKAWAAVVNPIKDVTAAFIAQEAAQLKLINSMKLSGDFTDRGAEMLKNFAKQLENTSRLSEETALSMLSLAKNSGLTNEQSKTLTQTAANLAAVTGKDVNTVMQDLLGQLSGMPGKISKIVPELKNMTESQLASGKGIELLAKKFRGFAESDTQSLEGGIHKAMNAFEDLTKEIGHTVVDLISLPTIVKVATDVFNSLADGVKAMRDTMKTLDFEKIAQTIGIAVAAFGALFAVLNAPAIAAVTASLAAMAIPLVIIAAKFVLIAGSVTALIVVIDLLARNFTRLPDMAVIAVDGIILGFRKLKDLIQQYAEFVVETWKHVFEFIGNLFSAENMKKIFTGGASIGDIIAKSFGDAFQRATDSAAMSNEQLIADIKARSKGLDLGIAGEAVKAVTGFMSNLNQTTKDTADSAQSVSDAFNRMPAPTQKEIDLLNKLKTDTASLSTELLNMNATEEEQVQNQLALEIQKLEIMRGQLDSAGAMFGELNKQIDVQEKLLKNIAGEKELKIILKNVDPIAANIATGVKSGMEGINDTVIPAFNNMFGTQIQAIDKETINTATKWTALISNGFVKAGSMVINGFTTAFGIIVTVVSKVMDPDFWNGLTEKINKILNNLPEILGRAMDAFLGAVDKILDKGPAILDKLINKVEVFFAKLMKRFPEIAKQMGEAFLKITDSFTKMAPQVIGAILKEVPGIIDKMFDAMVMMTERLPLLTAKIFDAIPDIVGKILDRLPDLLDAIFKALPQIVAQIFRMIAPLWERIMAAIPDIVESLITGIIGAVGEIVAAFIDEFLLGGGLERIIGAFLRMIPKLIVAIVRGIVNGLIRAVKAIFGGVKWDGLSDTIQEIPGKLEKGFKKLAKNFTKETSNMFKVADFGEKGQKLLDPIKEQAEKFQDNIDYAAERIKGLWERIKEFFEKFGEVFTRIWEWAMGLIAPLIEALQALWTFVYDSILRPMIDGLTEIWHFVYDSIVGPLVDGLRQVWQWVYDSIISKIVDIVKTAWNGIIDFFQNIFKGKISEAFSGVISTLSTIGTKIWEGLRDGVQSGIKVFTNIGGNIWEGLKGGIDTLPKFFKDLFKNLDPSNLMEKAFKMDFKGKGTVEKTLGIDIPYANFARGGMIPGQASVPGDSFLNDKILALLSPGEAVIPRSKMNDPAISQIVDAILDGTIVPSKFAFGSGGDWNPLDDGGGGGLGGFFDGVSGAMGKAWDSISGAAQGVLGPIASTVASVLDSKQLKSLGDAINSGKVNINTDAIGKIADYGEMGLDQAMKITDAIGNTVSDVSKWALDTAQKTINEAIKAAKDPVAALKKLDPRELWKVAKEQAWKTVTRAMSANSFHTGGLVPAFANGGDVPSFLQPGEFVMQRSAVQQNGTGFMNALNNGQAAGSTTNHYNITLDLSIDASAQSLDENYVRNRLLPTIKKELRAATDRGELIIASRGVDTRNK